MADEEPHGPFPVPVREEETSYLYRYDPETSLPVIVGKIFVDKDGDAWVRINSTKLAAALGVEDIDGVALVNNDQFEVMEP
ncbi:hypothetical protein PBI_CAMILLE_51 [Microbacterium phage Camille]|nr:hypothetical protein PBI_CAMILLE_51 [Microbacterium phage Camille]